MFPERISKCLIFLSIVIQLSFKHMGVKIPVSFCCVHLLEMMQTLSEPLRPKARQETFLTHFYQWR